MPKSPVPADIKRQILDRIKEGKTSITEIAQEHGLSDKTIYRWLSKGATSSAPSWVEYNKLKRENAALKELLGRVMLEIEILKKKN